MQQLEGSVRRAADGSVGSNADVTNVGCIFLQFITNIFEIYLQFIPTRTREEAAGEIRLLSSRIWLSGNQEGWVDLSYESAWRWWAGPPSKLNMVLWRLQRAPSTGLHGHPSWLPEKSPFHLSGPSTPPWSSHGHHSPLHEEDGHLPGTEKPALALRTSHHSTFRTHCLFKFPIFITCSENSPITEGLHSSRNKKATVIFLQCLHL